MSCIGAMTRCLIYSIAVFVAACLVPETAHSQSASATLQGTVSDEQGAILPGASVTIKNVDTGLTRPIVSDARGWYHAAALPPGRYELQAELSGFASERRSGLTLTVGQDATVNVTLKIAAVAESISVTASAPLVETSDNTIGTTITRNQLDNLPIVGRDFSTLAQTAPGIAGVGGGGVSAGGQRDRANSFLVDGVSNDQVNNATTRGGFSLETVREFIVLANQFSAEYGQASGAIVSVVTRSGTNKIEGRGFLFDRDDHLDSQDPFSAAQGSGKAPFSMKRFGGFLGGPIVRDRLHYFGSYEGLRQSQTSVVTSKLVPVDQREFPNDNRQHLYFVKSDVRLNDANSVWARYRLDSSKEFGSGIGGLNTWERGLDNVARNQDVALSHTAVVSARALQEFRFQFGQQVSDNLPYLPLGTPEVNRPSGNFGKAYNQPQGRTENHYQFIENFSYARGSHDLKTGVAADIVRVPAYFYNNVDGTFRFTTDLPFDAGNQATYPVQFTQNVGSPFTHRDTDLYNVFFQDSWRMRRNLTFNAGVRYDVESAYKKALGIDDDKNNVVPRLGFVWDPFDDGRTAVRGGYGWYVDQVFLNLTANLQQARNFTGVTILNPGYPDPFSRGSAGNQKPSTVVVDPNVQTPQTRQISVGIKREVRTGLALSADFVNSRGYHLYNAPDVNSADPITGLRPDPDFLRITRYETTGNSWYKGLLVGLEKRSGRGPNFGVSYTLARLTRDVEDFQSRGQDPLDRNAEKSLGDNNRTHQFVANITWALPRAFQIGAVLQMRSGLPWTITTGLDNNGDTVFNERPDVLDPSGDPLNPASYFGGFTGRVGTLGRNSVVGPSYVDLQTRASKLVKLPRGKVELFIEAFNLTNRTNLGRPVGNLRSAQFGTSSAVSGPPRQVQLGFRVDF
jgi:hypothetical protein